MFLGHIPYRRRKVAPQLWEEVRISRYELIKNKNKATLIALGKLIFQHSNIADYGLWGMEKCSRRKDLGDSSIGNVSTVLRHPSSYQEEPVIMKMVSTGLQDV